MGDVLAFPNIPAPNSVIGDFRAVFSKMAVDRAGNLVLTFKVPPDFKYQAIPVTDHPGMVMRVQVKREVIVYSKQIVEELKRLGIDEFEGDAGGDGEEDDG